MNCRRLLSNNGFLSSSIVVSLANRRSFSVSVSLSGFVCVKQSDVEVKCDPNVLTETNSDLACGYFYSCPP